MTDPFDLIKITNTREENLYALLDYFLRHDITLDFSDAVSFDEVNETVRKALCEVDK